MMLYPEKRQFQGTDEGNGTMVAIYSTLREDVYVVFAGMDADTKLPVIHAFLNPLVKWIWLGGVWVVMGTLLALMPNRRAGLAVGLVTHPAASASPIAQAMNPSVTLREGHD